MVQRSLAAQEPPLVEIEWQCRATDILLREVSYWINTARTEAAGQIRETEQGMMNRETSFRTSDTLIVSDRSRQRRWVIIGAVVALLAVVAVLLMMMSGSS